MDYWSPSEQRFRSINSRSRLPNTPMRCGQCRVVSKAWLHDGDTVGGFHVFTDQAAADGYKVSELAAGLRAMNGFDDFEVRGFDILEGLSELTGVSSALPLAAR
jgi:hypothetical protein